MFKALSRGIQYSIFLLTDFWTTGEMRTKFRFGLVPQSEKNVMKNFQIKDIPAVIIVDTDGTIKQYPFLLLVFQFLLW